MNSVILTLFGVVITPWKLIGYSGVLLFAGRWVFQLAATRREGKPTMPRIFWTMSVSGSALLLAYFIWGKNDSVGVLESVSDGRRALQPGAGCPGGSGVEREAAHARRWLSPAQRWQVDWPAQWKTRGSAICCGWRSHWPCSSEQASAFATPGRRMSRASRSSRGRWCTPANGCSRASAGICIPTSRLFISGCSAFVTG